MEPRAAVPRSHLFTVRIWEEDLGEGRHEWRGRIVHVLGEEERCFRDWDAVTEFMLDVVTGRAGDRPE